MDKDGDIDVVDIIKVVAQWEETCGRAGRFDQSTGFVYNTLNLNLHR